MSDRDRVGKGMRGMSPHSRYLSELSSGLRLRDGSTRAQLLSAVERDLRRTTSVKDSYETLVKELGPPMELAARLSDPKNWTVQMGTPLLPRVPLAQAISPRGRMMIASFIVAMFLVSGALFVLLPSEDMAYPVMLMVSAIMYLLVSAVFYAFIGYAASYGELKDGGIGVEACPRSVYKGQLVASALLILLLDTGMVLYPLAGDRGALMISVPLGIPPMLLALAVVVMAWRNGRALAH